MLFFGWVGLSSLSRPWIGIVACYLLVILAPQHIWWWTFEGTRPFFIVASCSILGFLFVLFSGRIQLDNLKTKINFFFLVWFIMITLSYLFGAYIDYGPGPRFFDPDVTYPSYVKMFFFYFISVMCIDEKIKIKYFAWVMVISIIYMIYWANDQYLSGNYWGRLSGPKSLTGGQYVDENSFAMLFVTGLPFLYYMGFLIKRRLIRYCLWLVIPFGWHAIFLTGSRGGLLSLGVIVAMTAFRSPKKIYSLFLIPVFLFVFVWQAGDVMKNRANTIEDYQEEESARTRLEAWAAALSMMETHPFIGVGLSSFGPAFPDFSDKKPRVAHNTFFQIGGESGIIALFAYVSILFSAGINLWKNKFDSTGKDSESYLYYLLNEAILVALSGFVVSALFLSLNQFEIFFYIAVLFNFLVLRKKEYQLHGYRYK